MLSINKCGYIISDADFNTFINMNEDKIQELFISEEESEPLQATKVPNVKPTTITDQTIYRGGCYLLISEVNELRHNNRYKIGMSKNLYSRITDEGKYENCRIICMKGINKPVDKIKECEQELIKTFTETFGKPITESENGNVGKEWFEINDIYKAEDIFLSICQKYDRN